jgi:hypothetical protein
MFGEIYYLFGQGGSRLQVFEGDLSSLDELVMFSRERQVTYHGDFRRRLDGLLDFL